MRSFGATVQHDEDTAYYWAEVPSLPGVVTQGATIGELRGRLPEAIALHLDVLKEDGQPIPGDADPDRPMEVTVTVAA
jgi:predicted RNase H-like HicB family nuclease